VSGSGAGPRSPAEDSAADRAEDAAEDAEQAAEEAQGSADAAEESADDSADSQRAVEEQSEEFLRDTSPDEGSPDAFGPLGQPLKHHSPFYIGFFAGVGALLAWWLGGLLLSIGSTLVLIVVAFFLAAGLNPAVEFFIRRGVTRSWSVLLVILSVLIAITLFVMAIVPVIGDQVTTIVERAPDWLQQLQTNHTIKELDNKYDVVNRLQDLVTGGKLANKVFGGVLGVGVAVLSALLNTFVVVVLMLYFLASLPGIKRFGYRLAPASRRERVAYLGDEILGNVGAYVSGAFVVALCAGVSSMVFLFIVGLGEYAVALAVVVMILDVIPMIGATIGALVVIAIGFATDPKIGLACVVFYVIYQQFENYLIYPRVMSRSVDIPGSLIVIAALIGAGLLGVVGALLAIPTAAAVQLLLKEVVMRRQESR
jgi:predicted PurR-regulated permease PerM